MALVIGLMSGTSLDGIDAALVEFEDDGEAGVRWTLLGFEDVDYSRPQRAQIHEAILDGGAAELCRLHAAVGEWFADAALAVCRAAGVRPQDVDLIGSHGQTVWHEPAAAGGRVPGAAAHERRGAAVSEPAAASAGPPAARDRCCTLQLGCPATIAERTGIAVVSDFRARDVAAGGEGAPLVAWTDRLLFSVPGCRRALQNIGGMANVTWLPPREAAPGSERERAPARATGTGAAPADAAAGRAAEPTSVLAFDTGPGMAMINAVVELATDGAETYDRDGRWAARGRVDRKLLEQLLAHPFFDRAPPKSTGRETFGRPLVESLVSQRRPAGDGDWADLAATVTALTARSIGDAYRRWVLPRGVDEVVLTGGGAYNPVLRRMVEEELAPVAVRTGEEVGIGSAAKEAVAFAALAWAHGRGMPGNVPDATGAAGPRVLGSYTPGTRAVKRTLNP